MLRDEKELEKDAERFDVFLKENDKSSVDAIKLYTIQQLFLTKSAETETKLKMERVQEGKKLHGQLTLLKSEISRNEGSFTQSSSLTKEILKDLEQYKSFIDILGVVKLPTLT